jgi:MoxR-like ATPase
MSDSHQVHVLNPFETVRKLCASVTQEIAERIVGQEEIATCLTAGLIIGGHVLMEGVPGLGKTLLAKTLADVVNLRFSRIQFTPDMMPSDILGTHMVSVDDQGRPELSLQKGPIFANIVLADEINRASPKTQSALLEAMQERQVSLGSTTYPLNPPFFVAATQNPLESEGTYPLPDAQLDRFLMKLLIPFPSEEEVMAIVARTTGKFDFPVTVVAGAEELNKASKVVRQMPVADSVMRYAVRLIFATHATSEAATEMVRKYIKVGASPRAAQSVMLVAKFFAILDGRMNVALEDVNRAAYPCLRHRLVRSFDAVADDVNTDAVIADVLKALPKDKSWQKGKK